MKEKKLIKFPPMKIVDDDFEVNFELGFASLQNNTEYVGSGEQNIIDGLNEVNESISSNSKKIEKLSQYIDKLTNQSDYIDYTIAVGSGILAGIIDSFWVGELNLERGKKWSEDKVNLFIIKIARTQGYKGDDLQDAIKHLEKNFGAPSDSNTSDFGGGLQHHLRDFAHHPNGVGFLFSMLTQFTGKAYGTDEKGIFKIVDIKNKKFIGKDIPQKFLFGTVYWFFHMVSDMAGSSSYSGAGTGLPGPLLALAKELSALPIFKNVHIGDNRLTIWISKLFNGTLLAKRTPDGKIDEPVRFDLRTEFGVAYELGRQAIPVIINESIVRGFYFIRRLAMEINDKDIRKVGDLDRVDWDKTIPFRNRTIVRMLTIATGTFTVIDLGDAAIRAGIKSGGSSAMFAKEFILRVNFVGIGKFAIAATTDVTMGVQREKLRNERIAIFSEQLHLMNAKIYYLQADAWIAAELTDKAINEAVEMMRQTSIISMEAWNANKQSMQNIGKFTQGIEKNNASLIDDINDILTWR